MNRTTLTQHRDYLFDLQKGICPLCETPMAKEKEGLEIDHIFPFSISQDDSLGNLQLVHWSCNRIKRSTMEQLTPSFYREAKEKYASKKKPKKLHGKRSQQETVLVNVRLPHALLERFDAAAAQLGLSRSARLRMLIVQDVKNNTKVCK